MPSLGHTRIPLSFRSLRDCPRPAAAAPHPPMNRIVPFACALLALLAAAGARAGSFGVSPTRVDLDRGAKSAIIEVTNDDEAKLSFQAKLFEWRQGADGKDEYAESQDLIYFPQIFTIAPKAKRIIRVGIKGPPGDVEKAYRLFVE